MEAEDEELQIKEDCSSSTVTDNKKLEEEINKRLNVIIADSGEKLFTCTVCNKEFRNKKQCKFHIETHLEGFSHTCNICGKWYKTRKVLLVHKVRHTKGAKDENN